MSSKILIVDDERDIVLIIKTLLSLDNYKIDVAYDGKEALEKIKIFNPDIILLDEMLPIISGNEVAKILKKSEKYKKIPIIMITARYLKDDKIHSLLNVGVDDYITKPFDPEEVRARVKSMLRIKKLIDEREITNKKIKQLYNEVSKLAKLRGEVINETLSKLPWGVIFCDKDGKILECNNIIEKILDKSLKKIKENYIWDVFKDLRKYKNNIPESIFLRFEKKENDILYLNITSFPVEDNRIFFIINNTEYKNLINIRNFLRKTKDKWGSEKTFFEKIVKEIKDFIYSEAAYLIFYNNKTTIKKISNAHFILKKNIAYKNIKSVKKILFITDTNLLKEYIKIENIKNVKNLLIIPIKIQSKIIGHFILLNSEELNLTNKLDVIDILINMTLLFYENTILTGNLQTENKMIKDLLSVSAMLNSTLNYNHIISVIINSLNKFINMEGAGLFITNKNTQQIDLVYSKGLSKSDIEKYLKNKLSKSEILNNSIEEDFLSKNDKLKIFNCSANSLTIPLKIQDRVIGFILIKNYEEDNMYEAKREILRLFAEYSAKAIENAYLFDRLIKQNEELINTTEILKYTEQRLLLTQHLASLGKFAAAVAHEIRNPLTIMLSTIESFKEASEKEKIDLLSILREKIIDIDHTLSEMMELAKPLNLEITPIDVKKSIDDTMHFISKKAKENNISIKKKFSHSSLVYCDRLFIERVFLNLYLNAFHAMKKGGVLTVETQEEENYVLIKISDTGEGIPSNIKDKIFEPFFTTKKSGTGLGLYNVKRIIELSGGKINFISDKSGTTFFIYLLKFNPEKNVE